jgi:hypothetical protein
MHINNRLLLIIIIYLIIALTFAVGQPNIVIDQKLSHDIIWAKGSGQIPDSSTVTLNLTGLGNVSRKSVDAVIVIDDSNSMVGPYLSSEKSAAKKFIAGMDPTRDKIGFVSFNMTLGPNSNLTSRFNDLSEKIDEIATNANGSSQGDTCLSLGLNRE